MYMECLDDSIVMELVRCNNRVLVCDMGIGDHCTNGSIVMELVRCNNRVLVCDMRIGDHCTNGNQMK